MFSLQRNLSFRYLREHRTRTALVVLSIALGVVTLVATRVLNGCLNQATRQAVNPLAGIADLLVVNAQTGVPRDLARDLRDKAIPGLQDAEPLVLGRVYLPDVGGGRSALLLGIRWPFPGLRLRAAAALASGQGDLPPNPWGAEVEWDERGASVLDLLPGRSPVFVGGKLARELDRSPATGSRRFAALAASRRHELVRLGTVRFSGADTLEGGNFVLMDVADAATLVYPGRPGNASQINLTLAEGVRGNPAAVEEVRRRVQAEVGDAADVRTVEANFESARDVLAGLQLGFSAGGVIALVVGLFLVYNVLSVSVAERRHDIGVLRAVGATRGQVAGLFLGEAGLLGLAGSLLGLPMGYGFARAALGPLQRVLSDVVAPVEGLRAEVSWQLLLASVAAGTATAMLAGLFPALAAASEEPADAVRRAPRSAGLLGRTLHLAAVALLLGAGVAAIAGRERLPLRAGVFAGLALLMVAALAAMPLIAGVLGRFVQPVFRVLFGLEGRLAADNLVRTPGRTGLVIAALAATGTLMVGVAGYIRSTERAVRTWIDRSIAADLFVTCGGSIHTASLVQPTDGDLGQKLRSLPGVESVLGIRFHLLDFRDRIVFLLGVDADAFRATPGRELARNLGRFPRLREPGTALVSENFAALYKVRVGDRVSVRGRRGPVELEVIGTVLDYTWNRGTIIVDRRWYAREFGDTQVDLWDVYLGPGVDPEGVRGEIERRWRRSEALFAATRAELQEDVTAQLARVYYLAYAQQLVVGVVALIGVVSALFISVLQRRRELGLLRAVGASRGQVLRSVLAEAALMGLIGGVLGLAMGVFLEWYIVGLMVLDEAGFSFPLRVPWAAAGVVFGLSVGTATLVGLWPAYLATRLRIPEAIAYE
jgi:putative ABC transport system permease protein